MWCVIIFLICVQITASNIYSFLKNIFKKKNVIAVCYIVTLKFRVSCVVALTHLIMFRLQAAGRGAHRIMV